MKNRVFVCLLTVCTVCMCVCICVSVFARSCVCLSVNPNECVFIFAVKYAEVHITDWGITTEPDDIAGRHFFSGPNSSLPSRVKAASTLSYFSLVHAL